MKVSIEHYIATNNPSEVAAILTKRGIPAPKNLPDAIQKLQFVMSKEGNSVAKELAVVETPYQQMIKALNSKEESSNACGCSGFNGEKQSNCAGCTSCSCNSDKKSSADAQSPAQVVVAKDENKDSMTKHAPLVAIGLLLIVTTAILIKK